MEHARIHISGIVQGVGFRPFVYREALAAGVTGWVANGPDGVHIEAHAEKRSLESLLRALRENAPAAARIDLIDVERLEVASHAPEEFRIVASATDAKKTALVSPDIATCPDCLRELFDPANRRYRYPFVNCTACGPRFTIVRELPYDRARTSMSSFPMCEKCAAEYENPLDRRFHAQPDACFECGPHLVWREQGADSRLVGRTREQSDAIIERAAQVLKTGGIVAVKGLGGFHLACDAGSEHAVQELRHRKRRPAKPFAVMAARIEDVEVLCHVDEQERTLLTGSVRPIVLLRRRMDALAASDGPAPADGPAVAHAVAGDLPELGVMLPYTPLQHLLLDAVGGPLVMTSGNVSGEPIETDDDAAWERLVETGIADALLGNDRPILSRFDDSVARVTDAGALVVRRARGYAPTPIQLPKLQSALRQGPLLPQEARGARGRDAVLACGTEQKSTLAYAAGDACFLSQHIGDLHSASALDAWHEARTRLTRLFDLRARAFACDLHPAYATSRWACDAAQESGLPLVQVQHHHAHIAAVLAENIAAGELEADAAVIGIAFDGTGAGVVCDEVGSPASPLVPDGTVWGGEVLACTLQGFTRLGSLAPWHLPGGEASVRDAARNAYALLAARGLSGHPVAAAFARTLPEQSRAVTDAMLAKDVNCPKTTSAGRLFDAVAALLGICRTATYEGEPAIELEAAAWRAVDAASALHGAQLPPFALSIDKHGRLALDPAPALEDILDGIAAGADKDALALGFHETVAQAIAVAAKAARERTDISDVALAGGVFMNRLLLERTVELLGSRGFRVLLPRKLPVNDGGVAYGQAAVAQAVLERV